MSPNCGTVTQNEDLSHILSNLQVSFGDQWFSKPYPVSDRLEGLLKHGVMLSTPSF